MSNIDTLVEQLGKLTVIEAGELAKKTREDLGFRFKCYNEYTCTS